MEVDGKDLRPIWLDEDLKTVKVIDQRLLPHQFVIVDLKTVDDIIMAIKEMYVRGAPLIGVTGAYGVYLATLNSPTKTIEDHYLKEECDRLKSARPTAVNLVWGVDRVLSAVFSASSPSEKIDAAR
jgi:methylthioribose-1-phosphate isomerase